MAEPKTRPTGESVDAFIEKVADAGRREDCRTLVRIMKQATRSEPRMWGTSIVGFGTYLYKYPGGGTGEWPLIAFSPRKQDLSLYIMSGFEGRKALMARLGKHKTGKCCLYLKRLTDVDLPSLEKLVSDSVKDMKKRQHKR